MSPSLDPDVSSDASDPQRPRRWRQRAVWALAGAWLVSSWIATAGDHPMLKGAERLLAHQPSPTPMHNFVSDVHRRLEPETELALWRPDREPVGLAHWWITESYRLAPRKVYPLLTVAELEAVPVMADDLRAFLKKRSEQLAGDGPWPDVAVIVWAPGGGAGGGPSCHVEAFPELETAWRQRGCLLRPASNTEHPAQGPTSPEAP